MTAPAPRRAADSIVDMTQLLLPGETNALGGAFGGSVMGWIDICAAVAAPWFSTVVASLTRAVFSEMSGVVRQIPQCATWTG